MLMLPLLFYCAIRGNNSPLASRAKINIWVVKRFEFVIYFFAGPIQVWFDVCVRPNRKRSLDSETAADRATPKKSDQMHQNIKASLNCVVSSSRFAWIAFK